MSFVANLSGGRGSTGPIGSAAETDAEFRDPAGAAVMKMVDQKRWDWVFVYAASGVHEHLTEEEKITLMLKAVENHDVSMRNVVVFREMIKNGFVMDNMDVALSRAITNRDFDLVYELCDRLSQLDGSSNTYPHNLPIRTILRVIDTLEPHSRFLGYVQDAKTLLATSIRNRRMNCNLEEAKWSLQILMTYKMNFELAGAAVWQLIKEHKLSREYRGLLLVMETDHASKMNSVVRSQRKAYRRDRRAHRLSPY